MQNSVARQIYQNRTEHFSYAMEKYKATFNQFLYRDIQVISSRFRRGKLCRCECVMYKPCFKKNPVTFEIYLIWDFIQVKKVNVGLVDLD